MHFTWEQMHEGLDGGESSVVVRYSGFASGTGTR